MEAGKFEALGLLNPEIIRKRGSKNSGKFASGKPRIRAPSPNRRGNGIFLACVRPPLDHVVRSISRGRVLQVMRHGHPSRRTARSNFQDRVDSSAAYLGKVRRPSNRLVDLQRPKIGGPSRGCLKNTCSKEQASVRAGADALSDKRTMGGEAFSRRFEYWEWRFWDLSDGLRGGALALASPPLPSPPPSPYRLRSPYPTPPSLPIGPYFYLSLASLSFSTLLPFLLSVLSTSFSEPPHLLMFPPHPLRSLLPTRYLTSLNFPPRLHLRSSTLISNSE